MSCSQSVSQSVSQCENDNKEEMHRDIGLVSKQANFIPCTYVSIRGKPGVSDVHVARQEGGAGRYGRVEVFFWPS